MRLCPNDGRCGAVHFGGNHRPRFLRRKQRHAEHCNGRAKEAAGNDIAHEMVVCAEQPDGNHQHWDEVKSVIARVVRPEHDITAHMPVICPDGKASKPEPPCKGLKPKAPSRMSDGLLLTQVSGQVRPKSTLIWSLAARATTRLTLQRRAASAAFGMRQPRYLAKPVAQKIATAIGGNHPVNKVIRSKMAYPWRCP